VLDEDDGAERDLGQDVQHGVEQHLQERGLVPHEQNLAAPHWRRAWKPNCFSS